MNLVGNHLLAVFLLENAFDLFRDLLSLLEVVGIDLGLNFPQLLQRSLNPSRPSLCILLCFLCAADPMQTITTGGFVISLRHIVAIHFRVWFAVILSGENMFPLDSPLPDSTTELFVFLPRPGHHGDKTTMPARDFLKIFLRGEFAVCDIDEIRSPEKSL